jgi:cytochrome c oxidase cbb3-type subunit 2
MNHGPLLFLGVLGAIAASWYGLVVGPHLQFGQQAMVTIEQTGRDYPAARAGQAHQGSEVYRANGCFYCHTQQVLPYGDTADLDRKWGTRRTVARDYLRDQPAMLGRMRLGPDLANIGMRETNRLTLLLKLYNARIAVPSSTMPRYPYLFEQRKLRPGQTPSPDALPLPEAFSPGAGFEVVPRPEADALVAYLQSLHAEPLFYEVFPPPTVKRTNRVAVAQADSITNQPAAVATPATNTVAPAQ